MNPEDDSTPGSESETPSIFLQFLSGMAAQTLMHLGAMRNPLTGETKPDLANAKYSLDLLGVLEQKTQGRLDPEEERYLRAALRELRLQYVRLVENPPAENKPAPSGPDNN